MTHILIEQFRTCLIAACMTPDTALWAEAARRYDLAERGLSLLDKDQREQAATELYRLLPSEWPFWMEMCRQHGSDGLHWRQGITEAYMVPCRGSRRASWVTGASLRH